jgi:hypothetical protein
MTAVAGSNLEIRLVNRGHPIHLTLSVSNAGLFTAFQHENLYVEDELEYSIPIKKESIAGFFDLEIITGYGTQRARSRVIVEKAPEKEEKAQKSAPAPQPAPGISFRVPSIPLTLILAGIALILYILWLFVFGAKIDVLILNVIAFLALLASVPAAWYRQR